MSSLAITSRTAAPLRAGLPFAIAALVIAALAAVLAGFLPIWFSIVTVFLFAGPHNWLEARYFLGRMPARWGRLSNYFVFAFAGIFGLAGAYAFFLVWSFRGSLWTADNYDAMTQSLFNAMALWNTAFVLWVAVLVHMRSRQNPRRDWSWIWPVSFLLIALTWFNPALWSLGMVYGHPLIAFWVLDRELKRTRPQWRPAYHLVLALVPLILLVLWWQLAQSPNLEGDALVERIAQHAGADIINGDSASLTKGKHGVSTNVVSTHLLVATHTFLEMLHYGVWVVVIPLVAYRARPWNLNVPLARRSPSWRQAISWTLGIGLVILVLLWGCFLANYPLTREIYFTVAMLHVLAEVPFLLRSL